MNRMNHARPVPDRLFGPGAAILLLLAGGLSGFAAGVALTVTVHKAQESFARDVHQNTAPAANPSAGLGDVSQDGFTKGGSE